MVIFIGFYIRAKNKVLEVTTAIVAKEDIVQYVEELGVVKSEEQITMYSKITGIVSEILVDIGDKVKKGDILVKLDEEQIRRDMEELRLRRDEILAEYNEAKKPIDNKEIGKLELEIQEIEKGLKNLKNTVDNRKILYDDGAISREEYEGVLLDFEKESINLEKAKLELELALDPISKNVATKFEAQLKQLNIQEEKLKQLYKDSTIVSSTDGVVFEKFIERGSYLQPGTSIMDIGNIDDLYIESDILVEDISNIFQEAKVYISNDDLNIADLKGKVRKIHPYAFTKVSDLGIEQKRIRIDIQLEDNIKELRPGYDLDIKIVVEKIDDVLTIPKKALFLINGKDFVFVNEDNKARLREVTVGIENDKKVEIIKGLDVGEEVILSPDNEMKDGINIKEFNLQLLDKYTII